MPTAYIFLRLRNSTDQMPRLTFLRQYESVRPEFGRNSWVRVSDWFPWPPHRLVEVDIGADAYWMLHHDSKLCWSREQAQEALRRSVDTWVSWSGGVETAARLEWVDEVEGRCTVLAKTTGEGVETRRWWAIAEVHIPSAQGIIPPGP